MGVELLQKNIYTKDQLSRAKTFCTSEGGGGTCVCVSERELHLYAPPITAFPVIVKILATSHNRVK